MSEENKDFDPWKILDDEELDEVSELKKTTAELAAQQSEGSGSLDKEDFAAKPESTATKFGEKSLSEDGGRAQSKVDAPSEGEKLRETEMQEAAAASEKAKKEHDELVCQLEATKKQLAEERATQAELKKTRAEQEELVRQLEAARKQLEDEKAAREAAETRFRSTPPATPPPLPSQDRSAVEKRLSPPDDESRVKINRNLFNR